MKVFELFESDEFENSAFESKKAEISALVKKRKAIEHQTHQLFDKLKNLVSKGIILDEDQFYEIHQKNSNNNYVGVKGAGTGNRGFGKYYKYYVDSTSPNKPMVDKIDIWLRDSKDHDKQLRERIKALTVRGNSFCFTGVRDADAEQKIRSLGGYVHSSVTNDLDYLVAKDPHSTSGKALKARNQGTKVISQQQLADMLRD